MNLPRFKKIKRKLIVMDGTDLDLISNITKTIQRACSVNGRTPKVVIEHNTLPNSSMVTLEFQVFNKPDQSYVRKLINREYPGLCIFDTDCKSYGISI